MKMWLSVMVVLAMFVWLAGCGNVQLSGDAMTAAQTSTLEALGFYQRVQLDANASPLVRGYALENVTQWRWFVRSAKRDMTWGPKLPGDPNS